MDERVDHDACDCPRKENFVFIPLLKHSYFLAVDGEKQIRLMLRAGAKNPLVPVNVPCTEDFDSGNTVTSFERCVEMVHLFKYDKLIDRAAKRILHNLDEQSEEDVFDSKEWYLHAFNYIAETSGYKKKKNDLDHVRKKFNSYNAAAEEAKIIKAFQEMTFEKVHNDDCVYKEDIDTEAAEINKQRSLRQKKERESREIEENERLPEIGENGRLPEIEENERLPEIEEHERRYEVEESQHLLEFEENESHIQVKENERLHENEENESHIQVKQKEAHHEIEKRQYLREIKENQSSHQKAVAKRIREIEEDESIPEIEKTRNIQVLKTKQRLRVMRENRRYREIEEDSINTYTITEFESKFAPSGVTFTTDATLHTKFNKKAKNSIVDMRQFRKNLENLEPYTSVDGPSCKRKTAVASFYMSAVYGTVVPDEPEAVLRKRKGIEYDDDYAPEDDTDDDDYEEYRRSRKKKRKSSKRMKTA